MTSILLLLTSLSVITDVRTGRIPKYLPLAGICIGIMITFQRAGPKGLVYVFTNVSAMFIITFLLFLTHALRGGDGKLMCAISAITGLGSSCRILFAAMLISIPLGFAKKRFSHKKAENGSGKSLTFIHFTIPVFIAVLLLSVCGMGQEVMP